MITKAERELTFAGYANYFLWLEQARLGSALKRKAAQGCRVRFLVGDPDSELTRSREQDEDVALTLSTLIRVTLSELEKIRSRPGIDARYSDGHTHLSVFRFDDGMFDRFASHVEEL
ncbi:hypothetical protein [Streptomyces murinus]|uniref:hypothetical protein n=1 Tax=Streptomyces murinus TaxID=33900 RepID=UPI00381FC5E2